MDRRAFWIQVLRFVTAGSLLAGAAASQAGLQDFLRDIFKEDQSTQSTQSTAGSTSAFAGLTQAELADAARQALEVGVRRAIDLLGRYGGYLNDPQVRIPMPSALQSVDKALRAVGQQKYADEFVATMNHAAEKAVPETTGIFIDAIKGMEVEDAQEILQGADNAATIYFKQHTTPALQKAILPIVQQATDAVGVTSAYKQLIGKSGFMGGFVDMDSLDVDRYVTDKAIDGLFVKLAQEEKLIRQDPAARSTELLKKVFGSLSR
jgi:hypothetical protein